MFLRAEKKLCSPARMVGSSIGGKVMVDPVTGSPWARQGAKKVLTDRPLKYTHQFNPEAQARWFEVAKAQNQTVWMEKIKDWILNGGGSGV